MVTKTVPFDATGLFDGCDDDHNEVMNDNIFENQQKENADLCVDQVTLVDDNTEMGRL